MCRTDAVAVFRFLPLTSPVIRCVALTLQPSSASSHWHPPSSDVSHWRCSRLPLPPTDIPRHQMCRTDAVAVFRFLPLISPVIRRNDGKLRAALLSRPTCFTPLALMPLAIFQRFLICALWFPFKSPLADCAVLRYLLPIVSFIMGISLLIYVLFVQGAFGNDLSRGCCFGK